MEVEIAKHWALHLVSSEQQAVLRLASGTHRLSRHSMSILEEANKLSVYEPPSEKLAGEAEGQFVLDDVRQNAGCAGLRIHSVGMFPAVERACDLDVPELPSFNVVAVLELPTNPEGAQANAQSSSIAITNSRRRLYDFHRLPRR